MQKILEDPMYICFGRVPQNIIDEWSERAENVKSKNPTIIKTLESSVKKSLQKYNKTKDEASNAGRLVMRDVIPKIHPMVLSEVDANEQILMDFRE